MKLKTQACPTCEGTGNIPADDVGPTLRTEREKAGIAGSALATQMGISDSYLYDLEKGNRKVTNELLSSYLKGMEVLGGQAA